MTVTDPDKPAASPVDGCRPFDTDLQAARFCGMEDFLPELLDIFRKNAPAYVEAVRETVYGADLQAASKAAHALKGMCSVVCAQPLGLAAASLEEAARDGDQAGCLRLLALMEQRLAEARECLAREGR